jgi:hypothetical protein
VQAQYCTVVRPERLSWVEKVLEAGAGEARFEVVGEACVFLAEVVEERGGEVAEVEVVERQADGGAEMPADEAG